MGGDVVVMRLFSATLVAALVVPGALAAQGPADSSSVVRRGAGQPTLVVGRLHYDGGGDWYANRRAFPI